MLLELFIYNQVLLTNEHIKIEFEKVSGNKGEVKNLVLYGDYFIGNLYQPLQISSEETINQSNVPFLRQLERITVSPMFEDLVKQHRNFMRSKDLDAYLLL